jgi:O-antigen biosynthesis protein WbqV
MTVEEASGLVLDAAAQTAFDADLNGALYVLDMGEPVSILRLARQLLRLRGRDPDAPGAISIVGLRPGEKRHENLVYAFERREPTDIDGVWSITGPVLDTAAVSAELECLLGAARSGDAAAVSEALGALCALRPATAAD